MIQLTVNTSTSVRGVMIDKYPTECPHCGHAQITNPFMFYYNQAGNHVRVVCACTNNQCARDFIGHYVHVSNNEFYLRYLLLGEGQEKKFEEPISRVSPDFISIYNQAHKAEVHGLDQICGPGFRKALEFLIKDYVIFLGKDKVTVEKMMLGPCIETFVENSKIKEIAKRAAWIGNDETHFIRKWADKDVNDLKNTINLTVHWIVFEELQKRYVMEMPDPSKK